MPSAETSGRGIEHPRETALELFILRPESFSERERDSITSHLKKCEGCCELAENITSYYEELRSDLKRSDDRVPAIRPADLPQKQYQGIKAQAGDRPLKHEVDTSLPFRIARWVTRHPAISSAVGFSFACILGVAFLIKITDPQEEITDWNPALIDVKGVMLLVQNRYGQTIGEIQANQTMLNLFHESREAFLWKIGIADVNNDGQSELIWVELAAGGDKNKYLVHCRGFNPSPITWTVDVSAVTNTLDGEELAIFNTQAIYLRDTDHDQFPELYAVQSSTGVYSRLLKMDAQTGQLINRYQHYGSLLPLVFSDVSGDSTEEIVFGGMNNAFNDAVVLILDPRNIGGYSEHTGKGLPEGKQAASELGYIRIPRTVVGFSDPGNFRNRVDQIDVVDATKHLRVSLNDNPDKSPPRPDLHLVFDSKLRLLTIEPGDGYNSVADSLFKAGNLKTLPDSVYFEGYKQAVSWWDGQNWKNFPTYAIGRDSSLF